MKNYLQFINEKNDYDLNELRYSIFDFDDNILCLDTIIHYQKNVNGEWVDIDISTEQFARIKEKYDKYWDNEEWRCDFDKAFLEFRDFGPRGDNSFLEDVKISLEKKNYGPSWDKFIETLINGNLFGIVTTRGHEPNTIRKVVEYIIYNELNSKQQDIMLNNLMKYNEMFDDDFEYLIDDYLNNCYFIGIMSDYFEEKFGDNIKSSTERKKIVVDYIVNNFKNYKNKVDLPVKIGFSDDDLTYYKGIKDLFVSYNEPLDDVNFYVFNTSDPNIKGGKKIKI